MSSLHLDENETLEQNGDGKGELEASESYAASILFALTVTTVIGILLWFVSIRILESHVPNQRPRVVNWSPIRDERELLIIGILIWLAARPSRSNFFANVILVLCVASLVAIHYLPPFSYLLYIGWWLRTIDHLCEWFWMYVGIVCASAWFKFALIPSKTVGNVKHLTRICVNKHRKARLALWLGFVSLGILVLLDLLLLTTYASSKVDFLSWFWFDFVEFVIKLFSWWLLGLCFAGFLMVLERGQKRRILGVASVSLVFVLVFILCFMAGVMETYYVFILALMIDPDLLVTSPLGMLIRTMMGYVIAIVALHLVGFRFAFLNRVDTRFTGIDDYESFDTSTDAFDPEMYL